MLEVHFPDQTSMRLSYLLCDVNGTISLDGKLIEGVEAAFNNLKQVLEIYLLTADTQGTAEEIANFLGVKYHRLQPGNEARQKEDFLMHLGAEKTIAMGQGANDVLMLKKSMLGICVLSKEGIASQTLLAADLVAPDILTALEILQNPKRIIATLRQ